MVEFFFSKRIYIFSSKASDQTNILEDTTEAPKDDIYKLSHTDQQYASATDDKSDINPTAFHSQRNQNYTDLQHGRTDKPQTISQLQRSAKFTEPTMPFSRYSKQHSKAAYLKVQQAQTKSQYVKKSDSKQSNTKILLRKASDTPKAGISHQPLATTSYTQEEMTSTNFPALPAIAKPSKSALGLQCFNFNDKNNPKQTRSEETSQTKDPFQDRLQQNEEKLDKMIEILKSLRKF